MIAGPPETVRAIIDVLRDKQVLAEAHLEIRRRGNSTAGSNPTPSASLSEPFLPAGFSERDPDQRAHGPPAEVDGERRGADGAVQ